MRIGRENTWWGACAGGALCLALAASVSLAAPPEPLKPEISDVAKLASPVPHRFFTLSYGQSIVIFDGDSGKLEGEIPAGHDSNLELSSDSGEFFVSETMWTHGNRGTRADLLSIYDSTTLNLKKEINLPGRALVGMKIRNLGLSASGKRAYVYNMHPASSLIWVDLLKETVGGSVEIPGCALVFPWGENGVSSLCGDGSMAVVTLPDEGPPKVTHTQPFFDAANDPIFDNSLVDSRIGTAVFLTYTGLIYQAKLGPEPSIDKPWSIQAAAGLPTAGTRVDELAWRPGGGQPFAWHKDSDRIFVLMHPGDYWSHNDGATEIWVLNLKTHALVARFPTRVTPAGSVKSIAVSQHGKPQLYVNGGGEGHDGGDTVLDADTGEVLRKIEFAHGEAIVTPGS